jgi:hypothetical protein
MKHMTRKTLTLTIFRHLVLDYTDKIQGSL